MCVFVLRLPPPAPHTHTGHFGVVSPTFVFVFGDAQELMSRTSLETQKLDLMDEVSFLKLKLVSMEETSGDAQTQDAASKEQNKAEVRGACDALF